MGQCDKSVRITKTIAAIKSGDIQDYSKAAKMFQVDRTTLSERIRGITQSSREEADSISTVHHTNIRKRLI
jgi:hypothetical protein